MIYLTSDLHLGHGNILRYCKRPFVDVDTMNETLIKAWNETVGPKDDIYVLGDWTMGVSMTKMEQEVLPRLQGNIYTVAGNHDSRKLRKRLENICVWVKDHHELVYNGRLFVLNHFPFRSWKNKSHGSINLHGHCHSPVPRSFHPRQVDVGVDAWEYAPVSIEQILVLVSSPIPETGNLLFEGDQEPQGYDHYRPEEKVWDVLGPVLPDTEVPGSDVGPEVQAQGADYTSNESDIQGSCFRLECTGDACPYNEEEPE